MHGYSLQIPLLNLVEDTKHDYNITRRSWIGINWLNEDCWANYFCPTLIKHLNCYKYSEGDKKRLNHIAQLRYEEGVGDGTAGVYLWSDL